MEWILMNIFKIIQLLLMKFKNYRIISQQLGLKQPTFKRSRIDTAGPTKRFFYSTCFC